MKNKTVPEIRYKNIEDEWKLIKLSDLMNFSNGINASKESYGRGRKMISVMDILSEEGIEYKKIRNSVEVKESIESKNKVENGDLIFVRSSEVRNEVGWSKAYLQEQYALHSGFTIRGKKQNEYDAKFIECSLNYRNRYQIESKAGGSTRYNVGQEILKNVEIYIPSLKEQLLISTLIQNIENKINLHQQELGALKQTKLGFSQKMFPKEGEITPSLRIKGYVEKWTKVSLEEKVNIFNNLRVPVTSSNRVKGKVPYYGANGVKDYVEGYTHNGEFVLIAEDGANDLINYPVQYVTGKVWVNNHAHVVSGKSQKLDTLFLKYRINSMNISKYLVGGGRSKLNLEALKKLLIVIPSFEEQVEIGSFFSQLDEVIKLKESELEVLKQIKQGFLQKMFV